MAISFNVFYDLYDNCGPEKGNTPGRYLLEEAELDYGGVTHGISLYIQEIYIFEDIDKPGITGWCELMDLDNLVSAFLKEPSPSGLHTITGQELLRLKFKTFGSEFSVDHTQHPLHVHKIENLRPYDVGSGASSAAGQLYRIHFCAPELMNNERVRVSQAYEDTYSEIVKDIMKTHLKTKKDVWIEDTQDIIKIIIPNMHPFDAIRAIADKARNKTHGVPGYNFYETTKGYRFKTLHAQDGTGRRKPASDKQMHYTIPGGAVEGNYLRMMINTIDAQWLRIGDTYSEIRRGMFASKMIEHDSYHKVVHHGSARYTHDLPSLTAGYTKPPHLHITPGTAYVPTGDSFPPQVRPDNFPEFHDSKAFDEFPDGRVFYNSTSGVNMWERAGADGVTTTGSLGNPELLTKNLDNMQHYHDRYTAMRITVYGLSGLQVGDGIQLELPSYGADKTRREDARWAYMNTYYITKLVHKVNLRKDVAEYHQDLVICPDTVGALPPNGNLSGGDSRTGAMKSFKGQLER